jgi:hypothetical protein
VTHPLNAAELARIAAELLAPIKAKPCRGRECPGFQSVRKTEREARLKALGYKHPELWQADPFVRKTGALDD